MAKRNNIFKELTNPDGTFKRFLEVIEVLPDGTRVFEGGWKARPSMVDFGDERGIVRLDSLTPEQKREWEDHLMKRVGKEMSEYYQSLETGAGRYS